MTRNFTPPQQCDREIAQTTLARRYKNNKKTYQNPQAAAKHANSRGADQQSGAARNGLTYSCRRRAEIYPIPCHRVGVDGYYKIAREPARRRWPFRCGHMLTASIDRVGDIGLELKSTYNKGTSAPGDTLPWQNRSPPISCRTSFCSLRRINYISHALYITNKPITRHFLTASAGPPICGMAAHHLQRSMILYCSGLRSGFAKTDQPALLPQVNMVVFSRFQHCRDDKPTTVRFRFVNVFRQDFAIRDGSWHRCVRATIRFRVAGFLSGFNRNSE